MKIVLMDMEWNWAFSARHSRFINEIVEIGAVMLDEELVAIDTFDVLIQSRLTKKLTGRFKELTNISNEDMLGGMPLEKALDSFFEWTGKDYLLLTWSDTDIRVLLENVRCFLNKSTITGIYKYADLQKFVMKVLDVSQQISLFDAAERLSIDTEEYSLHRAIDDSYICALILQKTMNDDFNTYIKDVTNPEFYARMQFKAHYISDINSPKINKGQMHFPCKICGKYARRLTPWKFKSRGFRAEFVCKHCNEGFSGTISYKQLFDSVVVNKIYHKKPPESRAEPQSNETGPEENAE